MIFSESPRRKQINDLVTWGHWFALANIMLATAVSSIYILSSPIPDSPLAMIYLIATWLGHTSFITFFAFVIFLLPMCYQVHNVKVVKTYGSIIAAVSIALLAFDALLYNKTGFHVSYSSALLLKSEAQVQIGAFSWLQWFYLLLLFVIWLMFQLVVANALWKRVNRLRKINIGAGVTSVLLSCFVASHGIHVWSDAKLYNPVLQQDNMFPLSYPATAKTLMSRYGILDLQNYKTRQNLQFKQTNTSFIYPPKPLYCSVDNTAKFIVLNIVDDNEKQALLDPERFQYSAFHIEGSDSFSELVMSTVYGVPSVLHANIQQYSPVLVDLFKAFNLPFNLFTGNTVTSSQLATSAQSWDIFRANILEQSRGISIGFVTQQEYDVLMNDLGEVLPPMIVIARTTGQHKKVFSNQPIATNLSVTEDILPTLISAVGCNVPSENYSTGQDLQSPVRAWMVTTTNQNILVLQHNLITEVSRDGSYEVYSVENNKKQLVELNTDLLSRAIRHLSAFTGK